MNIAKEHTTRAVDRALTCAVAVFFAQQVVGLTLVTLASTILIAR